MKITVKKLSELRKPEKNVRLHTAKQLEEYVRSLEMFGQIRPLVVDEAGEIIAGNGLYDALVRMGQDTAECYVVSGLTEAQKKKLMLADNKVFELGITDTDAFEDILKDLGTDFDIPGYDSSMLEMLSMSFTEVDDYISGYGSFEPDEVERIQARPPENHTEGVATGVPAYSPPTPILNHDPGEKHEGNAGNGPEDEPTGRYVICPRCGERILLGGV